MPRYSSRGVALSTVVQIVTVLVVCDAVCHGEVVNLTAPELGVTQSSVLLLWDDTHAPDYTRGIQNLEAPEYEVLQDGTPIGVTSRRCFTVKRLDPDREYVFSVRGAAPVVTSTPIEGLAVEVTTESAGEVFNVRDYGAKGDGKTLDTPAIQGAIDACSPGGIVLVPEGVYRVDGLRMKSDMTLEIEEDAVLSFLGYREEGSYHEPNAVLPGPDGAVTYQRPCFLSGFRVENLTITGDGVIDGNGPGWWPFREETVRPFIVDFVDARNILVQGVTLRDSPAWANHLLYVDDAIYSDVKVLKVSEEHGTNGDGLNPQSSRNILIVGCLFGNQDDSIAIKAGRCDSLADKRFRSTENIVIRDCRFDGGAAPGARPLGCAIGSENSGGVRNVLIKDCEFIDTASLINIKTNRERLKAVVENVVVENCTYVNTVHKERRWNRAALCVDASYASEVQYPSRSELLTRHAPAFRSFTFRNIFLRNAKGWGGYINGLDEKLARGIAIENVLVQSRDGLFIRNASGLAMEEVSITPAFED